MSARRALLGAALGFLRLEPAPRDRALAALHRYMASWAGVGRVVVPLDRDGFRLSLSKIAPGEWRARFAREAMVSDAGYGVGATPWQAVQRAAWMAVQSAR